MTRNRHDCILPPFAAKVPASSTCLSSAAGTGSGFSRRMDRVVRMISNRSCPSGAMSAIDGRLLSKSLHHAREQFFGDHVDRLYGEAFRHAGPFRAHHQMIDAEPAMNCQDLLRHLVGRPDQETIAD